MVHAVTFVGRPSKAGDQATTVHCACGWRGRKGDYERHKAR